MADGKLIIFEGIDGSGKSSQYKRICSKLDADGISYRHIVFPRYDKESSALIRMYLQGQFGSNPSDVNAYTASLFFSVDRYASYVNDWGEYYRNGGLVLADRYTTSNAVHQGSKLNGDELYGFFEWLSDLEYVKMGLPVPDSVIYLDVDIETSLRRMKRRQENTHTSADIHEADKGYLEKCLETASKACDFFKWHRVDFMKDGKERDVEEKNSEIYSYIKSIL